jgi:hypothetical protein
MSSTAGRMIEVVSCATSSSVLFPRMSQHLPSPEYLNGREIVLCCKRADWPC